MDFYCKATKQVSISGEYHNFMIVIIGSTKSCQELSYISRIVSNNFFDFTGLELMEESTEKRDHAIKELTMFLSSNFCHGIVCNLIF